MNESKDLRVGHRERDELVDALRGAYAEGRLTPEEFDQRAEAALTARTFGDLDALVTDLPITPPSRQAAPTGAQLLPAESAVTPAPAGLRPDDPLVFEAGAGSFNQRGLWEVPPYLEVRPGLGAIHIEFLQAVTQHSVIHVEVHGGAGSLTVVVPDGWAANTDRLRRSWGSISNKVPGEPSSGRPLLVFEGGTGIGAISIRHANWFERRRVEKAEGNR